MDSSVDLLMMFMLSFDFQFLEEKKGGERGYWFASHASGIFTCSLSFFFFPNKELMLERGEADWGLSDADIYIYSPRTRTRSRSRTNEWAATFVTLLFTPLPATQQKKKGSRIPIRNTAIAIYRMKKQLRVSQFSIPQRSLVYVFL